MIFAAQIYLTIFYGVFLFAYLHFLMITYVAHDKSSYKILSGIDTCVMWRFLVMGLSVSFIYIVCIVRGAWKRCRRCLYVSVVVLGSLLIAYILRILSMFFIIKLEELYKMYNSFWICQLVFVLVEMILAVVANVYLIITLKNNPPTKLKNQDISL